MHPQVLSTIFIALFALVPSSAALGINCRGSVVCGEPTHQTLSQVQDLIVNGIDPNFNFPNGQIIACQNGFCAFLQNSNGATGAQVITLVGEIVDHGCKVCGSVPLGYPQTNDVSQGELTVNYVSNPCVGVCVGGKQ